MKPPMEQRGNPAAELDRQLYQHGSLNPERDLAVLRAENERLRETLRWLQMALNWAVFRSDSKVYASNEMRDIQARIDAALVRPE